MARNIPELGEQALGSYPTPFKIAKVTLYADTSAANDTTIDSNFDVLVSQLADSPAAAQVYTLFEVAAGTMVYDLLYENADSWGADSDVVEITVGDTAGANVYLTDTVLSPATTVAAGTINNMSSASMTLSEGKRYAAAAQIEASITFATTVAAATGRTIFWLVYAHPA